MAHPSRNAPPEPALPQFIVPGSKSLTQRALIIAALADGPVRVQRSLACDDSRVLRHILSACGTGFGETEDGLMVTPAPAPLHSPGSVFDCGNAGTALRFSACLALIVEGELRLDGNRRMRERPLGPLGDALASLGVAVEYEARPGFPPVRLRRIAAPPGRVRVDVTSSSQFASGLLLVAPLLEGGLRLELCGDPSSLPYIRMTTRLMEQAGAQLCWTAEDEIYVKPGGYNHRVLAPALTIEPDWSSAAFLLAAGRLLHLEFEIPDLLPPERSLQGDAAFAAHLEELAAHRPHELNLRATPDLIAPLAVLALFAGHSTRLHGVAHARLKECDRIAVLAREFRRLGAQLEEQPDGLILHPLERGPASPVTLDPEQDHRMAMAFGLIATQLPLVSVGDRQCVSKSFPGFWELLTAMQEVAAGNRG